MALQVIGAGLGRTGTLTLKTALETLGFGPCHHMVEVIAHPEQIPLWNRAAKGEAVDWEEIYGAYRATVDWPGCHYFAELAGRYPQAKVILSRRDPERWFESMNETIIPGMASQGLDSLTDDHPLLFGGLIIARDFFGFDFSKASAIAAFERHDAEVRRRIPADRLLVFEVAQGWEPLCAFLGVPVPAEPFPRVNDRAEFQAHAQKGRELSGR